MLIEWSTLFPIHFVKSLAQYGHCQISRFELLYDIHLQREHSFLYMIHPFTIYPNTINNINPCNKRTIVCAAVRSSENNQIKGPFTFWDFLKMTKVYSKKENVNFIINK